MSRNIEIKQPKWTDPNDIAYLSFFGTLVHGLRMEDVRLPTIRFELKRSTLTTGAIEARSTGPLLPAPKRPASLTEAQRWTLQSVASASRKVSFVPRALPGTAGLVTIEMTKVSDGRVPVYARRKK